MTEFVIENILVKTLDRIYLNKTRLKLGNCLARSRNEDKVLFEVLHECKYSKEVRNFLERINKNESINHN